LIEIVEKGWSKTPRADASTKNRDIGSDLPGGMLVDSRHLACCGGLKVLIIQLVEAVGPDQTPDFGNIPVTFL
jgi:hypothetical protein